jgi:hypothetical protein
MSDDNIIQFNPTTSAKTDLPDSIEERIYQCFHAAISFDDAHQKSCIYCLHNEETGNMLFEILAKDMTLAAKQKNLVLTTFDCKQALATALMRINDTEYEMAEKTSEETGARGQGQSRGSESGDQTTTEASTTVAEGVIEIGSHRKPTKTD